MKTVWSDRAIDDLETIHDFIARDDPKAALETVRQIAALVEERLSKFPEIGRPGRIPGTRELVVPGTPYIVPYRVKTDRIEIARIYHSARRWPSQL